MRSCLRSRRERLPLVRVARNDGADVGRSDDEWSEIGTLLARVVGALHDATESEKEYVLQLAEAPGFQHVHWHVVAVQPGDDLRGVDIFQLLKAAEPLSAEDLTPLCDAMRARLAT